jgi:tripartite-type tricarboxylate transporter receptor subunit TctC
MKVEAMNHGLVPMAHFGGPRMFGVPAIFLWVRKPVILQRKGSFIVLRLATPTSKFDDPGDRNPRNNGEIQMLRKTMAKRMKYTLAWLAMCAICIGGLPRSGFAGDYPELDGETIRVIITAEPGDTSDQISRIYFKSLQRELPNVTIRMQNIAAPNQALKELASASESGVTLVVHSQAVIYRQLIKPDDSLDLTTVDWVGSLTQANRMLAIRKDMSATSAQALLKMEEPVKFGASKFGSSLFDPLLASALTRFRFKVVVGMSEGERHAMILSGKLDARTGSRVELQPLIDNGEMVPFLKLKKDGFPKEFDSVPALSDLVTPDSDGIVLSTVEKLDRLAGLLIASGKMADKARLESLRRAVAVAAKSPDFVEQAEALGAAVKFTDGVTLARELEPIVNPASGVGAKMRAAIACGQKKSETGQATCK